jgi:hypothetical protein
LPPESRASTSSRIVRPIAASAPIPYAHQLRLRAVAPHDAGIALLVQQQAAFVDYDGIQIGGQGTMVVVDYPVP